MHGFRLACMHAPRRVAASGVEHGQPGTFGAATRRRPARRRLSRAQAMATRKVRTA